MATAKVRYRERKTGRNGKAGRVWLVDYVDASGARHQVVVRDAAGHSTREMAERALQRIVAEQRDGIITPHERRTFKQLRESWFAEAKQNVSGHTAKDYETIVTKHLKDDLDALRVDQITGPVVRKLKTAMIDKGLAAATVNKALTLLTMILNVALHDREVTYNAAALVPRVKKKRARIDANTGDATEDGMGRALSREELAKLIAESKRLADAAVVHAQRYKAADRRVSASHAPQCYHAMICTAAYAGLRHSEIDGLRWDDIDFTARTIRVHRTYRNGVFAGPKNGKPRVVPIPAPLASVLRDWRVRTRLKAATDLVFASTRGRPDGNLLRRGMAPAVKAADIGYLRLHDLRHTYGSMLLAAGEDLATVSRLLGHSDVAITAKVYTHAISKSPDVTTARLEAFLNEGTQG